MPRSSSSLSVAFWAVLINTAFGVGISLLLVRYTVPGRRALPTR